MLAAIAALRTGIGKLTVATSHTVASRVAARRASLERAAVSGVAPHARAGEALAEKFGPLSYLARELAAEVPRLMLAAQAGAARPI